MTERTHDGRQGTAGRSVFLWYDGSQEDFVMADVQCGEFQYIEGPRTNILTFRAYLNPPPTPDWIAVFNELQATEKMLGNTAVGRIQGNRLEFELPESHVEATKSVIRRCVAKTNPEAAKREAERQSRREAQEQQNDAERQRLRDKFRGGV